MTSTNSICEQAKPTDSYIRGLDSIRFFCALWVVFFHGSMPPLLEGIDRSSKITWAIRGIYGGAFNGPAAVILFFVVSGFCIHFPQRSSRKLRIGEFYARRSLRIGIPWLAASALLPLVGIPFSNFTQGIGWSLIAESTYYAIYPALLVALRKFGWTFVLALAYVGSIIVILTDAKAVNYASYGHLLNSVLGLPCWLLGCILAEKWNENWQARVTKSVNIWIWRIGVWAFTDAVIVIRHLGVTGDPWTLTLFSPVAYFWLRREVRHFQEHGAPWLFEWAGAWSYSIYLAHMVGAALFAKVWNLNLGYLLNWGMKVLFMLVFCYVFFLVVERPSHMWAKALGKRIARNRKPLGQTPGVVGTEVAPLPTTEMQ